VRLREACDRVGQHEGLLDDGAHLQPKLDTVRNLNLSDD
jgi:hypothetical protein